MPPNPKGTCTFYTNGSSELELHVRGIVTATSTEGNLLVLWLGHCVVGWDNRLVPSLETAENELRFSAFWPEDCCCCCHLRRGIGPSWVLSESGLEKTQGSRWVSPGSTEPCAMGQETGRTSDPPLSSASSSNYPNSLRLLTAVKAVLRDLTCPAIALTA